MINVLFVTSEASPFISTGGLGEVSGSLPRYVNRGGRVNVSVVLPMYRSIKQKYYPKSEPVFEGEISLSWRKQYIGIRKIEYECVTFYFIDNEYYFGRELIYGNYDDGERFAYFGKAVVSMITERVVSPDILHANDWQSALSVIYLKKLSREFGNIKSVFTVHNIAYQGKYDVGIVSDVFALSPDDLEVLFNGEINLLKGALCVADEVTTVSPTYARELFDGYCSYGLEGVIRNRKGGLYGITNGLDETYDPSSDASIPFLYSADDLSGKRKCRKRLCIEFCVSESRDLPVIAMVTRLVPQKGLELVMRVAEQIVSESGVVLVVLGTGRSEYEGYFRSLSERYRGKVGYIDRFDNSLSRLVYSGADMFLMPSLFEPCGIAQMTAQRYGTPPIVRETGGLKDTVIPYNEFTNEGTGFSFANYDAYEMKNTIGYAVSVFKDKRKWEQLVKNSMKVDNSWDRSAAEYVKIYKRIMG